MSELAFQYIGFGCVFLAALRVMDVAIHVFLGYIISQFNLDSYYILAVDMLGHTHKTDLVISTGTEQNEKSNSSF